MISPGFFFHSFLKFSFFGLLEGGSGGKRRKYSPKWKITSTSITCHISGTVCDHNVWYTCVKLWYIQAFFHFFDIFIFQAGKRAKNGARWKKNPVWCTSYLRNHISYDCHLLYTCVKWWYLQCFFHFVKVFILWVVRGRRKGGGERAKTGPKMRKNCVCCALYLRNHKSNDFRLWYSCVKW